MAEAGGPYVRVGGREWSISRNTPLPVMTICRSHHFAPVRARYLGSGWPEHVIGVVDVNYQRLMRPRVGRLHLGISSQYDKLTRLVQVRGGAIDTNHAGTSFGGQGISHQARAVGNVPNVNGLERKDIRRLQQRRVNAHTAFVGDVRMRNRGAVDFGLQDAQSH